MLNGSLWLLTPTHLPGPSAPAAAFCLKASIKFIELSIPDCVGGTYCHEQGTGKQSTEKKADL